MMGTYKADIYKCQLNAINLSELNICGFLLSQYL